MLLKNYKTAVPLGLLSLIVSVTIRRFGTGVLPLASFFEGLFLGMALVFAVFGLITTMLAHRFE
jgi:hypothetical protein